MADDVDPSRSPTPEPGAADEFGASEASPARIESMEIAMVEIEVVDLETIDDGPEPEPVPASESEPEPESKSEPPPDSEPESEPEPQPEDVEVVTGHDVPQPVAEVFVVTGEPTGADSVRPPESSEPVDPLPTMVDLDRVASELDDIDARLASLDEQRP